MKNIVLFGPPGCGKGTQSQKIVSKYGLKHMSTGDMLRKELADNTALGQEAKAFIQRGDLVTDELVIAMLKKQILQHTSVNGFLFDGFPRTLNQAIVLDKLLEEFSTSIHYAILMKTERDELIRRIIQRSKENEERSDDNNKEVIEHRLRTYESLTLPLKDYYKQSNKLFEIDGMASVEVVFKDISNIINS